MLLGTAGVKRRSGTGGVAAEREQAAGRELTGAPPHRKHVVKGVRTTREHKKSRLNPLEFSINFFTK